MPDAGGGTFVGRAHELETLDAALVTARAGQGGVAMLAGEPGIGKTRTAEEFARRACAAGAEVLVGRCYEGEGAPVFWPWVQVLRAYAAGRTAARLVVELGAGAPDVAAVVPEIRTLLPEVGAPPAVEPEQARFRFFDGVTTGLRRAATTRPIVLVLDDLHGADKPSLLLLQFLARELRASRVLVVGAHRDVALGPEHPLAQTLGELVRERVVERLELGGLSVGEVAELIGSVAGVPPAAEVAAAVHER